MCVHIGWVNCFAPCAFTFFSLQCSTFRYFALWWLGQLLCYSLLLHFFLSLLRLMVARLLPRCLPHLYNFFPVLCIVVARVDGFCHVLYGRCA